MCNYFPTRFHTSTVIYHVTCCRIFHHVEIAPFSSVAEGPHPHAWFTLDSFDSGYFAMGELSEEREPSGEG